jgi:glutaredoxin-like protein NrdH
LLGGQELKNVKGYFLSTCGWCKKTKRFLDDNNVDYEYVYVDQVTDADRARVLAEVDQHNPRRSFPTVVVSNGETEVVIGYREDSLREALGL